MEFEATIPVFERAKTVHALDRTATAIGIRNISVLKYYRGKIEASSEYRMKHTDSLIGQ
jgi:hypothetical protein